MITAEKVSTLTIESSSFRSHAGIPKKYSCEGENINPPLTIRNIPKEAKSLAIILEDPDATKGTFQHWLVWNILPVDTIAEDSIPGVEGRNGEGKSTYKGPCPPSGTHRYVFKVFALDETLDLDAGSDKARLEKAMQNHIVAKGELVGTYTSTKEQEK